MVELFVVGTITFGIIAAISVCFWNIRRMRCTHCKTPCCTIERQVMSADSMKLDELQLPGNKICPK